MTATTDRSSQGSTATAGGPAGSTESPRLIREYQLRLPDFLSRLPGWARTGAILFVLLAISVWIRTRYIGDQFWMDEAISVGISSHPLSAIPGILRYDGSPPLYYLLLHFWMSWVGNGEAGTRWLSLIFAELTVPVAYWGSVAITRNRRTGLFVATIFAFNGFLDYYGNETRMYTLMALLGLVATIAFIRGFVLRERRYVILFAVSQALMFYTHNWGLFYAAGSFLSLVILYFVGDRETRKDMARDAILAYIAAGILFIPWIPNFIWQVLHTAAPWDVAPRFGVFIQIAVGVLAGGAISVVMVLIAAVGYSPLFMKPRHMTREAQVPLMLVSITALTLASAWVASHLFTPAWDTRYFSPVVGAILLLLGIGISRAGVLGAVALAFVVFYMWHPSPLLPSPAPFIPSYKSDVQDISGEYQGVLKPRDLVLVGQPEQTALAYYYLPAGLRYANTLGPVAHPSYMNWVNALPRYKAVKPQKVVNQLVGSLKPGQHLLYIRPLTEGNAGWAAPWTFLIRTRSAQFAYYIDQDKQLKELAYAPKIYLGACCVADAGILYVKK